MATMTPILPMTIGRSIIDPHLVARSLTSAMLHLKAVPRIGKLKIKIPARSRAYIAIRLGPTGSITLASSLRTLLTALDTGLADMSLAG